MRRIAPRPSPPRPRYRRRLIRNVAPVVLCGRITNEQLPGRRINSRSRSTRLFVPSKRSIKTAFGRPDGHIIRRRRFVARVPPRCNRSVACAPPLLIRRSITESGTTHNCAHTERFARDSRVCVCAIRLPPVKRHRRPAGEYDGRSPAKARGRAARGAIRPLSCSTT